VVPVPSQNFPKSPYGNPDNDDPTVLFKPPGIKIPSNKKRIKLRQKPERNLAGLVEKAILRCAGA
jgi:hypothetical protein